MLGKTDVFSTTLGAPDFPFSLSNVENMRFPLLISVPHAGRNYPPEIVENLNVPVANLLRLEDRYADRLASPATALGFTTIIAERPRAWVDLNRSRAEIDPAMVEGLMPSDLPKPSRKVRGGLGIVPRRLTGVGNLWRRKWSRSDIEQRIEVCHEPYHLMVTKLLEKMRNDFGFALLLDLHSMPPIADGSDGRIDIVVGDRYGRSAGSRYSELCVSFFEQSGFRARLNHPYAGGYILERHSDPRNGIHALQLEIDRSCYLDENLREPGPQLPEIAEKVATLSSLLADQIIGQFSLAAAE